VCHSEGLRKEVMQWCALKVNTALIDIFLPCLNALELIG
jgi:hypothetical protein